MSEKIYIKSEMKKLEEKKMVLIRIALNHLTKSRSKGLTQHAKDYAKELYNELEFIDEMYYEDRYEKRKQE